MDNKKAELFALPGEVSPQAILELALAKWDLDSVLIIGTTPTKDGRDFVWGASSNSVKETLYLLEKVKASLDL